MTHEHLNSNQNPIKWNVPAVYAKYGPGTTNNWQKEDIDRNILNTANITELNGSAFDPDSVMLYFFPNSLTLNNTGTKENNILSTTDVYWITSIYPGGSMTPESFYKWAYNIDYYTPPDKPNNTAHPSVLKIVLYVLISLIVTGLIYVIIRHLL
jgi:hypothetical protein